MTRNTHIVIIYHPPPSSDRSYSTNLFLVEYGSLLEQYVADSASLLIARHFNFYVDDRFDKTSQDFLALIWSNMYAHQPIMPVTHWMS